MKNSTSNLNEIVKSISMENAISRVSQLVSTFNKCKQEGIKFSIDEKYDDLFLMYIERNFPDFNLEKANEEIGNLARENKYHEAERLRDETTALNSLIHKQFRKENYKTEDWFIPQSENEIFCLPTQIAVIDNLIFE